MGNDSSTGPLLFLRGQRDVVLLVFELHPLPRGAAPVPLQSPHSCFLFLAPPLALTNGAITSRRSIRVGRSVSVLHRWSDLCIFGTGVCRDYHCDGERPSLALDLVLTADQST